MNKSLSHRAKLATFMVNIMMKSFSFTILSLSLFSIAHATSIEQYSLSNASSKPIAVIAPTATNTSTTASTSAKTSSETNLQSEIDRLKEQIKQQDTKINQLNQAIQNNPNAASTSKAVATGPAATQARTTTVNTATSNKTPTNSTTTEKKATPASTAKTNNSTAATTNKTTATTTATKSTPATAKTTANATTTASKTPAVTKTTTTPAKANTTTATTNKSNTTAKATTITATPAKANAVSDKTAYEAASKVYQQAGAAKAITPMQDFIKNYPNSPLLPNAHFWLGEFNLSLTPPRILTAKTNFKTVVDKYPKSSLAPSALARLVEISQNIDKDPVQAEIYQKQLLQKYPESKEAQREKKINP